MKDQAQIAAMQKMASGFSIPEMLEKVRKYEWRKTATIGGDQDSGFEQSFASLSYTYISDKAPGLLDYMIGFQLVDRNDDNTKAVGVFGFKVGEQWLYVPVFFLSGDLKGHELMYLKNQNMFVPLKENWVNYIVNKRPQILGEGTNDSIQQMGVQQPNINNMIMPPFAGKYSSVRVRPWAKTAEVFSFVGKMATDLEAAEHADAYFGGKRQVKSALDLSELVSRDPRYVEALFEICKSWPGVKQAMDVHYGRDFLVKTIKAMQEKIAAELQAEEAAPPKILRKVPKGVPVNRSKVRRNSILKTSAADDPESPPVSKTEIITDNIPTLSENERQKLLSEGHLVRDARDGEEFTQQYNTQIPMTLSNPDLTGVYDVLVKDGSFEKCLVIFHPYGESGRKRFVTLVRLGGEGKTWKNLSADKVFVRQGSTEPNQDGKTDWYDELPEGSKDLESKALYVAITLSGQGTTPFEVRNSFDDKSYEVYWRDSGSLSAGDSCCGMAIPYSMEYEQPTVHLGKRKGQSILAEKSNLYLPDNCKIIKIKDAPLCKKCSKLESECKCQMGFSMDYSCQSDPAPIKPGDLADMQLALRQKVAQLKVIVDSCDVQINNKPFSKRAALFNLILTHGLSESDSKRLLKEAEMFRGVRWNVKYANGYPMMPSGGFPPPEMAGQGGYGMPMQQDPGMMGSDMAYGMGAGAQTQMPFEMQQQVPGLEAGMTDPNVYNPMMVQDPMAMQVAQQASQSGQKEVFDTAMLSSLTNIVHPEQAVDKDLGNIAKTLNTLGKMLFMFYWHNEEFEDRYGKKDLPELEDTLRNSFEMLGDLLLFLKQKTVDTVFGTSLANFSPNLSHAARN